MQATNSQKFQCLICMEIAKKPVATPCGHLFCWPCIYGWLRSAQQYLTCPICKSGLQISALRPIYIPNQPPDKAENGLPPRPRQLRRARRQNNLRGIPKTIYNLADNVQKGVYIAGYAIFPCTYWSFMSSHDIVPPIANSFEGRCWKALIKIVIVTLILGIILIIML